LPTGAPGYSACDTRQEREHMYIGIGTIILIIILVILLT
jgi:hypothetical protein